MKNILIFIVVTLIGFTTIAQKSSKEVRGDKYFKKYDYENAIFKYESLDDESITTEGLRNLAESYRLTFETVKAENAYKKVIKRTDVKPEDYYYYSHVLKGNKKYLEANNWMLKFQSFVGKDDLRVKSFLNSIRELGEISKDKHQFSIFNLEINTEQEDFGTAYYKDKIVFASSREGVVSVKRRWNGNDLAYLDLYVSKKVSETALDEPESFSKVANKKFHEGPASFNSAGDFMAFTRNSYTGKSSNGTVPFHIFFSEKNKNGEWSEPVSFHKNTEEYSIGHPHLSSDGKTMYFASDMPGGYGKADLYKVNRNEDGSWGEPENLGDQINTESNDMFPFYQESENLLFFASDGHFGLGGLDIFVAIDNKEEMKIKNLGVPINSSVDDCAFIINDKMKYGFFSSNREGGKGDDDIYAFEMKLPLVLGKRIVGIAKDGEGTVLPGVLVELKENGNLVKYVLTNEKGEFVFLIDENKSYSLFGTKSKYINGVKEVPITNQELITTDLILEKDQN